MKKTIVTFALIAVTVASLGFAGLTYARSQSALQAAYGSSRMGWQGTGSPMGSGSAHMDGYGGMTMGGGMGMMGSYEGMEALHDYMHPALAAALGLTVEEFEARHEAGESFLEIAESQGFTQEDALNLMTTVHEEALSQMVADGVITQEFADQMSAHMNSMHAGGFHQHDGTGCGDHNGNGLSGQDF